MPMTERYQLDFFAIIVLVAVVLIIVFLAIVAAYFMNLMNSKPPTHGESTFLFWTSIILVIIFLIIAIYAMIHIFTHKALFYEEPIVTPIHNIVTVSTPPTPIVISKPQYVPHTQRIVNIPRTTIPSDISRNLSDVPVTQRQRNTLNQELISLGSALED
jgi:hypothetical protein